MNAEEILETLADDKFISLNNNGSHWSIKFKGTGAVDSIDMISDKSLDRLIEIFAMMLEADAEADISRIYNRLRCDGSRLVV